MYRGIFSKWIFDGKLNERIKFVPDDIFRMESLKNWSHYIRKQIKRISRKYRLCSRTTYFERSLYLTKSRSTNQNHFCGYVGRGSVDRSNNTLSHKVLVILQKITFRNSLLNEIYKKIPFELISKEIFFYIAIFGIYNINFFALIAVFCFCTDTLLIFNHFYVQFKALHFQISYA